MVIGQAHFLPGQRHVFEPAVAQPALLALHHLPILLEREEIGKVVALGDLLERFSPGRAFHERQPHQVLHQPVTAAGFAAGIRGREDHGRLAGADRHE